MVSVRWVPDLILYLDCLEVSLEECEDVCVCVCMKTIQSRSCGAEHLWQVCMGRISAVLDSGLKMFLIYLILSYSVHHLSHTSRFSFSPLNLQFCTDTGGEQSHCRGEKKLSECDFWSKAKSLPFLFFQCFKVALLSTNKIVCSSTQPWRKLPHLQISCESKWNGHFICCDCVCTAAQVQLSDTASRGESELLHAV